MHDHRPLLQNAHTAHYYGRAWGRGIGVYQPPDYCSVVRDGTCFALLTRVPISGNIQEP